MSYHLNHLNLVAHFFFDLGHKEMRAHVTTLVITPRQFELVPIVNTCA